MVKLKYTIRLYDETEINIITNINLEIYSVYRFQPPFGSNIFVLILIGMIISISFLFFDRFFKRYYILLKELKQRRLDISHLTNN